MPAYQSDVTVGASMTSLLHHISNLAMNAVQFLGGPLPLLRLHAAEMDIRQGASMLRFGEAMQFLGHSTP